jgi:hypothetical protein
LGVGWRSAEKDNSGALEMMQQGGDIYSNYCKFLETRRSYGDEFEEIDLLLVMYRVSTTLPQAYNQPRNHKI